MGPVMGRGRGSQVSGGAVPSERSVMTEMPERTEACDMREACEPCDIATRKLQSLGSVMPSTVAHMCACLCVTCGKSQYLRVALQVAIVAGSITMSCRRAAISHATPCHKVRLKPIPCCGKMVFVALATSRSNCDSMCLNSLRFVNN